MKTPLVLIFIGRHLCRAPGQHLAADDKSKKHIDCSGADGSSESRARENRRPHSACDL